jgi:DNA topoisomerase-1
MAVVVVESPAKARTINKYLGPGYTVLASYGHVRDLPAKDGSVNPDAGFGMTWEVAPESRKHVRAIAEALKSDDTLILATDPDREGEAISWHLKEALAPSLKKGKTVRRVTFNAITRSAVTEAMEKPRDVDDALVEAYLARRALDYLVGFNLSPVLWRKLPGAKSAGRVQSVVLRLVVERELEIEAFRAREYWSVKAALRTPRGQDYEARLTVLGGKKLDKYDIPNATAAELAVQAVTSRTLTVNRIEARPAARNPWPPFMTSTLQQEASRKLGMGAQATMRAAQRLYEAGLITYMRTDGIDMAPEAVADARAVIGERFGAAYVPDRPRLYRNRAKNAQEAHECIRPTEMGRDAAQLGGVEGEERRLYDLIWKRAVASQMEAARLERTTVEIGSADDGVGLRATGQVMLFDGFLRVYEEGRDEAPDDGEEGARLPPLREGEAQAQRAVTPVQHFTQPPPRHTEATLVKRLEELGIGRPSTYAAIVTTIQDRAYVRKEKGRLIPEDKGRLVTAFLESYFPRYVGYDFTAALEEELDDISGGRQDWQAVLGRFWREFRAALDGTAELRITDVLARINEVLAPHLFPPRPDGADPRSCPTCGTGRLALRTARSGGAFIGCSSYPACRYTRPLGGEREAPGEARLLGQDPDGLAVTLRNGRFGPYVQLGDGEKPKRVSLPRGLAPDALDLDRALALLALPRRIGTHPDDGEAVEAGIGRFGPYLKHGPRYVNLREGDDVLTIGMNRAMELLAGRTGRAGGGGRGGPVAPLRTLGDHPEGGTVAIMPGRYGAYVKWGAVNATLPKGTAPETVTLAAALELIAAKAGAPKAGASKAGAPKAGASKAGASKAGASKAGAAKRGAKKPGREPARAAAPEAGGKATRGRARPKAAPS